MTKLNVKSSCVFSALPWLWLGGLVGLALRSRYFLGYWPSPSHPDPKLLPFELHYTMLILGFYLVVWLLPVSLAIYIVSRIVFERKHNLRPLLVYTPGWLVIVALMFGSHFSLNWVAWFLD